MRMSVTAAAVAAAAATTAATVTIATTVAKAVTAVAVAAALPAADGVARLTVTLRGPSHLAYGVPFPMLFAISPRMPLLP